MYPKVGLTLLLQISVKLTCYDATGNTSTFEKRQEQVKLINLYWWDKEARLQVQLQEGQPSN